MTARSAAGALSATRIIAMSLSNVVEKLNVQESKLDELQEQLHNHTYMLKELVERLRISGNARRRK